MSWQTPKPSLDELKAKFAEELLKNPNKPLDAGRAVFPDDIGQALRVSVEWREDNTVVAKTRELVQSEGMNEFLPEKAEVAHGILNIARDEKIDVDNRLKAYKLYGEYMGHIEKPNTTTNVQINTVNKVMQVPIAENDEDWEEKAATQQAKLVGSSSAAKH